MDMDSRETQPNGFNLSNMKNKQEIENTDSKEKLKVPSNLQLLQPTKPASSARSTKSPRSPRSPRSQAKLVNNNIKIVKN